MPEDSPPPLPPAEESPAADTEPEAASEPERAEPSSAPITEPLFVCECAEWMREACDGLPIYRKHTDKKYCVLHYPGKEKAVEFESAFQEKLEARDFNFRGVWFPEEVNFSSFKFSAEADFRSATFSAQADFISATFSARADFSSTTFKDQVSFSGSASFGGQSAFNLEFARIEEPERVSFHTVTLRPHWFVNVDPRKFVFTDVEWNWNAISAESEIQNLTNKLVDSPHGLLKIACRQLAENAETNNRYEEASHFRYWAMDLARQQKWAGRVFWKTDWLHVLYWAVSGYGERIFRAFAWLLAVWIVFALFYTRVGFTKPEDKLTTSPANSVTAAEPDTIGQPLPVKRAFTYSLGVMSLQKPEPKPLTHWAHTLVTLETILGPLQAALLALAIRRKFMR